MPIVGVSKAKGWHDVMHRIGQSNAKGWHHAMPRVGSSEAKHGHKGGRGLAVEVPRVGLRHAKMWLKMGPCDFC